MSKRIINPARKKLLKHKKGQTSLCSFVIISKQGADHHYFVKDGPCYAALEYDSADYENCIGIFAMVNDRYYNREGLEAYRPQAMLYLHWLLNESPYARNFDTKCPIEAFEEGVVVNTKHPVQEMQASLISYRQLWEYPQIPKVTAELYLAGVEGMLAYIVSHMFDKQDGIYRYTGFRDGHNALSSCFLTKSWYQNALSLKSFYDKTYNEQQNYYGVHTCFGEGENRSLYSFKDKLFKKHIEYKENDWGNIKYLPCTLPTLLKLTNSIGKELT